MPASYKGRGEKERQHVPVPITANLAALLEELKCDRPDDAPLLLKGDGSRGWRRTRANTGIFSRESRSGPDSIPT